MKLEKEAGLAALKKQVDLYCAIFESHHGILYDWVKNLSGRDHDDCQFV